MITARGIGWLFLILLVWAVLAYSGIVQLQIILSVLILLPILSFVLLLSQRKRLSVTQSVAHTLIQRGDTTQLQIRLLLKGWQMIGLAELLAEKPGQDNQRQDERRYAVLKPREETVVTIRLKGHHRGVARVGLKRLVCRDLFGLMKIPFYICRPYQLEQVLTILPRPYAFDPLQALSSLLQEKQQMKSWRPGRELDAIANIRQQQPGDALKRAHWKLTARLDEVMIREFENPLQQEVMILCDLDRQAARNLSWRQFGDFFSESAAWLVRTVLKSGCAVRLIAWQPSGRTEARAGSIKHEQAIFFHLAALDDGSQWQPDQLVASETARYPDVRVFILVTDRLNEATSRQMAQCALNGLESWLILLQGSELLPHSPSAILQPALTAGVTVCRAEFALYRAAEKNLPADRLAAGGESIADNEDEQAWKKKKSRSGRRSERAGFQ